MHRLRFNKEEVKTTQLIRSNERKVRRYMNFTFICLAVFVDADENSFSPFKLIFVWLHIV